MSKGKLVANQHDEIRLCVGRLRAIAQADGDRLEGAQLRRSADQELGALARLLTVHFAFEEQGGYMQWIVDARPEMKPETERLQRQHQEILTEVAQIRSHVADAPEADLKLAVGQVSERITTHDSAETTLLRMLGQPELS